MLKIEDLSSIKLKYKNKRIEFNGIDKYLMNVLNTIECSNEKKHFLIGNEINFTFMISFFYYLINEYIKNVCNKDNSILNDIKKGDKLVLKDRDIIIFEGIKIINGKKYIVGMGKKNCRRMILIENAHEITKYSGKANRINKNKGKNNNVNLIKEFVSDLMKIDIEELIGDIVNSTIIVVESKEKLYSLIYNFSIEYNGVKYGLSEIFPLAYYSAEDKFEFFRGNSIKQNAIIKFTVSSSVALDIVRGNENIRNVIFIGDKSYKNALETEIRQMDMYDNINKILLIDTWESNFDFTYIDDEFNVYAFTKNIIIDNIQSSDYITYEPDIQKENNDLIFNLVTKEISIYEVDYSEKVNRNIHKIIMYLKSLFDYSYENITVLDFLKIGYSLCNRLERTILPINKCKNNYLKVSECLDNMKKYLGTFDKMRAEYILMNNVITQFDELIDNLKYKNPKLEFLKKNFSNRNKYIIGIKNKDELNDLYSYFVKYPSCKFTPIIINKHNKFNSEDSVIITSYINPDEKNIVLTNRMSKIDMIVYEREKNKVDSLIRKTENMISNIENKNILNRHNKLSKNYFNINKIYKDKSTLYNSQELIDVEEHVDKIVEENFLNIYLNKNKNKNGNLDQGNNINVKKIIIFEDGNYSFLSNYYKASILENNDILTKEIDNLNINDRIVFTLNKINGEEDIVKIILKKLLTNEKFKDKYLKYFELNKLWKSELKKYMDKYFLSEADISNEFVILGKVKHKVTISNWLNGTIIGPNDGDDIRTIARIVNSDKLNENLDKVIEACLYERRIQIRVRKALAEVIVNSVVSSNIEDTEFKVLIKSVVDDIDKYAYIGTIKSIKDIDEEMNQQYVNRIIEREE